MVFPADFRIMPGPVTYCGHLTIAMDVPVRE